MVEFEFPHSVIITRSTESGFPGDPVVVEDVYTGDCDAQISASGGTGETSFVMDSDYTVFISTTSVEIKRGDKVSIIFNPAWSEVKGEVKQHETLLGFGTTIWIKEYGNQ